MIEAGVRRVTAGIDAAYGTASTVRYERRYPPTVNTPAEAGRAAQAMRTLVGEGNVHTALPPTMGAEDFAFMLQDKPGCYMRLGQGGADGGCWLHNSRYDFNDAVIPLGAGYLAALAERRMPLT
jgi:hippurate hydrolase